jgi:hypothetical protein
VKPGHLKSKHYDEHEIVDEVSPPKTPWFTAKPEQPFQPVLPHPSGRLGCIAAVNIESLAHAYYNGSPQFVSVFPHPSLLLGASQSHPENIRSRTVDLGDYGVVFFQS